jgi:hypothetical protein
MRTLLTVAPLGDGANTLELESDVRSSVRAWVYAAAMRTYLTLATGKGFDVDGELLEVARQLQVEGASPRLVSFTAHISGKVTHVLVNPEQVVFLAEATGSDFRSA